MRVILVDDERYALDVFEAECDGIEGVEVVGKFSKAREALEYVKENSIDCACLDIEMPGMNGIDCAKELRQLNDKAVIVFVTAYADSVKDARDAQPDYYLLKPYSNEDVEYVMERASSLSRRK